MIYFGPLTEMLLKAASVLRGPQPVALEPRAYDWQSPDVDLAGQPDRLAVFRPLGDGDKLRVWVEGGMRLWDFRTGGSRIRWIWRTELRSGEAYTFPPCCQYIRHGVEFLNAQEPKEGA